MDGRCADLRSTIPLHAGGLELAQFVFLLGGQDGEAAFGDAGVQLLDVGVAPPPRGGHDQAGLQRQIDEEVDLGTFIGDASGLNPDRELIKGVVSRVRVENVEDPLMQELRYMDKLIDELAKGKKMEKILRRPG